MKKTMKLYILAIGVLLVFALTLSACGGSESQTPGQTTNSVTNGEVPTTTVVNTSEGIVTTETPVTTKMPETTETPITSKVPTTTEKPHEHSFGEWAIVDPQTCTVNGRKERKGPALAVKKKQRVSLP